VCFEVEDLSQLPRWTSVIAHGRYEELAGSSAEAALDQLVARLSASPPAAAARPWQGAGVYEAISHAPRPDLVFRIVLAHKTGRCDR
jgi:nitroimidazol reductase NimA-like FMN-containing flavoprotein (pyridoxamine 5'-phosphate oxidase superfamily)